MRNSNKSLNDLFRSAEAEADGNVLSQSEVERLLQTAKRSVPVTQSIGQQLYQRLLSTPLKIGMTVMTTAACITLGLIAFWPTPQQTVNKAPILSHRTYGSQGTNGATQNFATLPTDKPSFVVNQPNEALPITTIIPVAPIATADSLQPVELTPEQLAQLGIVLEDNGDIDFYTKSGSSGKVIKLGLPPSWGVRLNIGQGISDADIAGLTILKSAPRLITEPNGSKRLFSFESDTTITNSDGHNKMVMTMTKNMDITPGAGNDSIQTSVNKMIGSMLKNVQITPGVSGDSIQIIVNKMVRDMLKNAKNSTVVGNDSMQINDSMKITVNSSIVNGTCLNEASALNQSASKNISEADINLGDINQSLKTIEEQASSIQLNHLIPIRIVNNKNAAHPNELIFWYEPSPELTAALPSAVNPVPTVQSKQLAISVYPNPTIGPATIHYELADAPRAYFSVRNLLGQEVMNGGMTSSTTGDANLDLSQLPAGVYLLVTTTDNGERDVERVVVTK